MCLVRGALSPFRWAGLHCPPLILRRSPSERVRIPPLYVPTLDPMFWLNLYRFLTNSSFSLMRSIKSEFSRLLQESYCTFSSLALSFSFLYRSFNFFLRPMRCVKGILELFFLASPMTRFSSTLVWSAVSLLISLMVLLNSWCCGLFLLFFIYSTINYMRSHTKVEAVGNIGKMSHITKRTMLLCLDDTPLTILDRPNAQPPKEANRDGGNESHRSRAGSPSKRNSIFGETQPINLHIDTGGASNAKPDLQRTSFERNNPNRATYAGQQLNRSRIQDIVDMGGGAHESRVTDNRGNEGVLPIKDSSLPPITSPCWVTVRRFPRIIPQYVQNLPMSEIIERPI